MGRFCRCNELRQNVTRIPLDTKFRFRYQPAAFLPQFNLLQFTSLPSGPKPLWRRHECLPTALIVRAALQEP
jgi:hypothetical protein